MSEATAYDRFNPVDLTRAERYKMLTGAVTPRPIAWVSSAMPDGRLNLAPFSQFVILAVDPALLGFSVGPGQDRIKDTLLNIERTGEFVINMVPETMAEIVQRSSADFAPEVSEAEEFGLDLLPSETIAVPRLACSDIQFECRLQSITDFGDAPNRLVAGRVERMHVREGFTTNHAIAPQHYRPLGRIGGRNYVRFGDIISL